MIEGSSVMQPLEPYGSTGIPRRPRVMAGCGELNTDAGELTPRDRDGWGIVQLRRWVLPAASELELQLGPGLT